MSNPEDIPNVVRGHRKGKEGRIFNVSINVPVEFSTFKGATARAEVFVPDNITYAPVTYNSPLLFHGLRNVNGHWIPGQAYVFNRPFRFYPPVNSEQDVPAKYTAGANRQEGNRIEWTNGPPTPGDICVQASVPFPHKTTAEDKLPQRPMARHETPVFKPVNEKLLEKKLFDGKWGAYIDINFPQRMAAVHGKEWIVESDPIKKFFVPYTPEYKYYNIKTVNPTARLYDSNIVHKVPEREYRFWPPMFPGQHVKKDWRERVSLANVNNLDRFDFNPYNDPLPKFIDFNEPKEEWRTIANGKVHGYTYQNIAYPPLQVEGPNKFNKGRRVMNYDRLIGTFPGAISTQFVEDSKYYKPVKLPTPWYMHYTETYEKYPNEQKYLYQEYEVKTPPNLEFWFFPPPKKGQLMDKLTKVQRTITNSKNGQRVFIYDTEEKQYNDVPARARGKISDEDARRKKSRKGVVGGQPSPLMKYAVLNRAKRRAEQMPPPREPSPPPVDTPKSESPPSRKRSGEQSPPSPSKRARSQSPPIQSPNKTPSGSRPKTPPPSTSKSPAKQQNPLERMLYYYNKEEAGSGSESEGEDSPTKNPSDPKPSSSKSPPSPPAKKKF